MNKRLFIIPLLGAALVASALIVVAQSQESPASDQATSDPIKVSISVSKGNIPVHFACVRWHSLPGWQQRLAHIFGLCADGNEGPCSLLRAMNCAFDGTGTVKGDSQDSISLYVNESFFPLELSVTCQIGGMSMGVSSTLTVGSPAFSWEEDVSSGCSIYELRFRTGNDQPNGIDITRVPAVEADDVQRCMQMQMLQGVHHP